MIAKLVILAGLVALFVTGIVAFSVVSHFGSKLLRAGPAALIISAAMTICTRSMDLGKIGLSVEQSPINPYLIGMVAVSAAWALACVCWLVHKRRVADAEPDEHEDGSA